MQYRNRRVAVVTSLIALVGLFVALAATAQQRQRRGFGEGGRGHHGPERMIRQMERVLDLTEDQVASLEAVFEGQKAQGQADRQAHRDNAQALKDALEAANPDPTLVGELMLQGRALREQAREQRGDLQAEVNAVLTPEQQATWEGYKQGRRGGRGHGEQRRRGPRHRDGRAGSGGSV